MDKILENIFISSAQPLSLAQLAEVLQLKTQEELDDLKSTIDRLKGTYNERGLELFEVAGGYLLASQPVYSKWIKRLKSVTPVVVSEEARVTLAIVAYLQPIMRSEIEELRAVDCESVLTTLLGNGFIHVVGELSGAYLYGTTSRFLESLGLKDLADLPRLQSNLG